MPSGGPPFIDRTVFEKIITDVPTKKGEAYQDLGTIYRDMSRLTVAWLGNTSPATIKRTYNDLGWQGVCNARALHECARAWLSQYHPELLRHVAELDK